MSGFGKARTLKISEGCLMRAKPSSHSPSRRVGQRRYYLAHRERILARAKEKRDRRMKRMKTDLTATVQELLKVVPSEKKQEALDTFLAIYNSYPSYRNLVGHPEYHIRMDEKLTHAYDEAIKEASR